MAKLFIRERRNVSEGDGVPRFEIVAVTGVDLNVYHSHVRKAEVEAIAAAVSAEIVYLPRGEGDGQGKAQKRRKSVARRAGTH